MYMRGFGRRSRIMPQSRTIAVVTGSRAEFGLLEPVMRAIASDSRLRLRVVVTGTHLSANTIADIEQSALPITARVPMQRKNETGRAADVAALARGVAGLGKAFDRIQPDFVLVLGDRIEALAAACAASVGGFRLAHIHGGDRAEGVADEANRHAISKMAHLHFAATATSRRRLIRMGEPAASVFNVGSPAVDALGTVVPAGDLFLKRMRLRVGKPFVIVMQHPVGAADAQEKEWMLATLRATAKAPRIVMSPNSDPGRNGILAAFRAARVKPVDHLPRGVFLRFLAKTNALVGNSSAGLIEAAAVRAGGVPVVNIGPRQGGRERSANVIDCDYGERDVARALKLALARPRSAKTHPYGSGRASQRIANRLAELDLARLPLRKRNSY